MRGLDLMSAMKDGRFPPPPVWSLVNFRLLEFGEGRAVMEMTPAEYHYNRFGVVQGGILCPVLDAAAGYAVHSTLPAGTGYTTLDLKVNYLRPVSVETGPLRCVGRIVHRGSRVCLAEADLTDGNGRLYAHAVSTCLLFKLSKKRAA
jgi:uncharacterized protein (TIGR00369 family)